MCFNDVVEVMQLIVGAKTFDVFQLSNDEFFVVCDESNVENKNIIDGYIDYSQQKIYIKSSIHRDVKSICLLNIALEILLQDSGVEELSGIPLNSVSQVVSTVLSPRLLQLLRDNTELFREFGIF